MKSLTLWKIVTADRSDFLERIIELLRTNGIAYCVIGGQAVNAYSEPVVSLDLDIVVTVDQLERAEALLSDVFKVERFPHSVHVSAVGSNLWLQIQTDERYFDFVGRSTTRDVLGLQLPVAAIEDVLRGKIWAASDPSRHPSKRLKDLADIARMLEVRPDLREMVPPELAARLI